MLSVCMYVCVASDGARVRLAALLARCNIYLEVSFCKYLELFLRNFFTVIKTFYCF